MSLKRVDRLALDGSTISIIIGLFTLKATKASYGGGLTIAKGGRMGSQEQTYQTIGSYKTDDCSFMVELIDYYDHLDKLDSNGFGNIVTTAVVLFEHPQLGSTADRLDGFRWLTTKKDLEAGEKMIEVAVTASCMQVFEGDRGMSINNVAGRPQTRGAFF